MGGWGWEIVSEGGGEVRDEARGCLGCIMGGLVAPWEELNFIPKTVGTFGGLSLKVVSLYPLWQCRVPS